MRRFLQFLLLFAAPSLAQDPETLPLEEFLAPPTVLRFGPYTLDGDPSQFLIVTFEPVAGATSYRVWREIAVDVRPDGAGDLAPLERPEALFVPWAAVNAVPGADVMSVVFLSTQEGLSGRWGLSSQATLGGRAIRSRIVELDLLRSSVPTAVEATGWAALKRR